jgi:hypothetical protein
MTEQWAVEDLRLDPDNPRMPDVTYPSQEAALIALARVADLGELVNSIGNSGWLDFEPMIILSDGTVVEGNRRLAALLVLRHPELQEKLGIAVPPDLRTEARPKTVAVNVVASRNDAREFIGFKHVNGAFKWDTYAKARFAYEWYVDTRDIDTIGKKLGDSHNTVKRLVNAYAVLKRSEESGFDRDNIEKKNLYFSHLFTALPAPSVRAYLGIQETPSQLLTMDSVPKEKSTQLVQFMTWLYGQGDTRATVRTQNPDLGKLVQVLGNSRAVLALESTGTLSEAWEMVEDKSVAFSNAVLRLRTNVQDVLKKLGSYDGDQDAKANVEEILEDMDVIRLTVARKAAAAIARQQDESQID